MERVTFLSTYSVIKSDFQDRKRCTNYIQIINIPLTHFDNKCGDDMAYFRVYEF